MYRKLADGKYYHTPTILDEDTMPLDLSELNKKLTKNARTTANVRLRWLKAIFTQIAKATSYIRKR